ncbi:alpha/beta fold hydrolase [Actibacterium sp. XHP0104]|uniref:alpha/beta fold hydrolase n=1 Tax=Actibacterium sp. XHP0104 TaxID=2984335 RepID=UPI0021E85ECC|nr:alpha/beta hydrolase [Actibacterium sp. XHP0104]MCV2881440.1 alpha/beta hydrolase [Actibacterium sp. XHP0104]
MTPAPLFDDIADGPRDGRALWLHTADGVRIRVAIWGLEQADRGTVLLFPGRTEYAEKYGRAAGDLLARGYATVAVDWRGQGLADHLLDDPMRGHVTQFSDFQHDVAAVADALPGLSLPGPQFMLAHSMGGAIGLRALLGGLEVRAAAFSAPMWGIQISKMLRPVAGNVLRGLDRVGLGAAYTPGTTGPKSYVETAPFDANLLTTDADMYRYMQAQLAAQPKLGLGGPTIRWVREGLQECVALMGLPAPGVPAVAFLGSDEEIVCLEAIRAYMAGWPNGVLHEIPGARHEMMMEGHDTRAHFFDTVCALFDAQRDQLSA